jgi:hypothetical protein
VADAFQFHKGDESGKHPVREGAALARALHLDQHNWMAARAAAKYGRPDAAKKITQNTAIMVAASGFREYYNPENGKGQGAKNFTWPALVLDMIDEYGLE